MSSNRIGCLIALCTRLVFAYTSLSSHSTCNWPTWWTMTKLWPSCVVSWVISNNVHMLVVVIKYAHCMCKIEAVLIIWTWWHLQNWWCIAKLKLSNELECRGIYLQNDVRHRYIDRGDTIWQVWWGLLRLVPIKFICMLLCRDGCVHVMSHTYMYVHVLSPCLCTCSLPDLAVH